MHFTREYSFYRSASKNINGSNKFIVKYKKTVNPNRSIKCDSSHFVLPKRKNMALLKKRIIISIRESKVKI